MARLCELTTPLGPDLVFSRMRASESLGRLFEIDLEVASTKGDIDPKALLGKSITVKIEFPDGVKRHFNGMATRFAIGRIESGHHFYHLQLRPWLWFLTRTADCRIFQEENTPAILKKVFEDEPAKAVDERYTDAGKYEPREYCVQYRETDFNFVSRLMEEEGITYFFDHAAGQHTMVLVDNKAGHKPIEGSATVPFVPAGAGGSRLKDHVSRWEAAQEIQSGVYVLDDYDFKRPGTDLKVTRKPEHQLEYAKADYEIFDYPGEHDTFSEGESFVASRIEELHTRQAAFHGNGQLRQFHVGRKFKLAEHARKEQNAEYLITATVHEVEETQYTSGQGEGASFQCRFSAIRADQQFRPARTTPRPVVQGIQTAVVTGPAGEEIHTDEYGRIKVQFHWDRYGQNDEKTTCFIRVAFLAAGAKFGFVSIPRIGHEVVVNFLEGDPDRPLVTGVVYNGNNKPPWALPANKTQSGFYTRSSKGGGYDNANAIRFEDKKGEEQVWIHAEKNQDIEVENDETHWVGHDRTKTIDHDEIVHVKHDRTETVDNNETITIGNNRDENVGVDETVTIGSNRTHTIGASETQTVALQRTRAVGVNETVAIGAAQEIVVGAAQVVAVGATQSVTVGVSRDVNVGKNDSLSVGSNRTVKIGKSYGIAVGENHNLTVDKNLSEAVKGDASKAVDGNLVNQIKGDRTTKIEGGDTLNVTKAISIDSEDSIVLKTGDASIALKKDGTIVIKGKDITIKGSGKINVKADSDIIMKGSKIEQN